MARLAGGLAFVAFVCAAGAASGQIALPTSEHDLADWDSDFGFTARYQKGAAIDDGGAFETMEYAATAWAGGPLTQAIQVRLDAAYSHTSYDFGPPSPGSCADPAACFANAPWRDVGRLDVSPGASLVMTPALRLRVSFPIRWNSEGDADGNAVTAGVVAQLQWELSSRITAGLGIGIRNQLEDDAAVYPAVSLDWRISPAFRLRTRGGAYQGGEVALLWTPSDFFQGVISAGYARQRFRLAHDSLNPDGIAEYTSLPLLAGLEFNFSSRLQIVAEGGMAVSGDLRIEDSKGRTLQTSGFDSAAVLRGYVRVAF